MHVINHFFSKSLNFKSLYEFLYNRQPGYSSLYVFQCNYFPCLRDYNKHKLLPLSFKCLFLRYTPKHMYTSRHVVFHEQNFPKKTLCLLITLHHINLSYLPYQIMSCHTLLFCLLVYLLHLLHLFHIMNILYLLDLLLYLLLNMFVLHMVSFVGSSFSNPISHQSNLLSILSPSYVFSKLSCSYDNTSWSS